MLSVSNHKHSHKMDREQVSCNLSHKTSLMASKLKLSHKDLLTNKTSRKAIKVRVINSTSRLKATGIKLIRDKELNRKQGINSTKLLVPLMEIRKTNNVSLKIIEIREINQSNQKVVIHKITGKEILTTNKTRTVLINIHSHNIHSE